MKLIIIAALNHKRVIGKNGKIPWHIPEDLQRFKQLTTHHTVLMGRKTFESIGKPLPQRKNIVISHNLLPISGIEKFQSLQSAFTSLHNEEKVFIIGGGEIFRQAIDVVDELLLTIVESEEEGDVFFPAYKHLIGKSFVLEQKEDHHGFSFQSYTKKND